MAIFNKSSYPSKKYNDLLFNQIIWRSLEPIKKKSELGSAIWFEINWKQAKRILEEFEGHFFGELIYHYENKILDIFQRRLDQPFSIKNVEFNLVNILNNFRLANKIIAIRNNNYIELRFILVDGRLDIVFKNLIM